MKSKTGRCFKNFIYQAFCKIFLLENSTKLLLIAQSCFITFMENKIRETFKLVFGQKPDFIVTAPGRINLIGEHTDYNGGCVLPAAIDKKITFALGIRTDVLCRLHSIDFDDTVSFELSALSYQQSAIGSQTTNGLKADSFKLIADKSWVNYLLGVIEQFQKEAALPHGFDLVFGGDIPLGAGLSSSAAVESGLAFAINEMFQLGKSRMELVKLAQRAENEFVGVRCGIMDMFASVMGKKGSVMRLDCRSLAFEYLPFNFPDIKIVLCDSGVKHSLADGEYNIRRAQCEEGIAILKKHYPNISTLRDVSFSILEKHSPEMPPLVFKRCRYIVNEMARVEAACSDLANHNLIDFGKKMFETHIGLSDDFGVSCEELDFLVECCSLFVDSSECKRTTNNEKRTTKSVYGARIMGGGFGGCTINLVKTEAVSEFMGFMSKAYLKKFNLELKTFVVTISDGTQLMSN